MCQRQSNVQHWRWILSGMRLPMYLQREQRKRLQSAMQRSLRENRLENGRPPVLWESLTVRSLLRYYPLHRIQSSGRFRRFVLTICKFVFVIFHCGGFISGLLQKLHISDAIFNPVYLEIKSKNNESYILQINIKIKLSKSMRNFRTSFLSYW